MEPRGKAFVVCGYGCHITPELGRYLDRVVKHIEDEQPVVVVFCGGYTQRKSAPDVSEAQVMEAYVRERVTKMPKVIREEESYTTLGNIRRASERLYQGYYTPHDGYDLTIFCETTRALKVAGLARYYFGFPPEKELPPIRIETESWELMHPYKELVGTVEAWLSIYLPFIDWWFARKRKARAKRI